MTARDRLDALFQEDTFQELGTHIQPFGPLLRHGEQGPAGRRRRGRHGLCRRTASSSAFSQDFTVVGGSLGKMHAKKIVTLMQQAAKLGSPVVAFKDSAGARIQEGVDALSGYGDVFYLNVLLSGVVPQIAVVCGPCAGGAAYSPALMDFIVMTRKNAYMFITGPEVIKAVTGKAVTMDEVGSADMHASVSGNVHFLAEDDADAIRIVHQAPLLPSGEQFRGSAAPAEPGHRDRRGRRHQRAHPGRSAERRWTCAASSSTSSIPANSSRCTAPSPRTSSSASAGSRASWSASSPTSRRSGPGALDMDAADKGARFIRFCNCFNIPLVTLVDVPGFMPGVEQERGGIIRHGAKLLFAYASCTTPKVTVILRKAYGGSYLAMCSQEMGADFVFAWPTAEIAVMGAEGAVKILYNKELKAAADPKAKAAELAAAYRAEFASPYMAAGDGYITDVIEPAITRSTIALALRKALSKREVRPPKKHGNIPL